MGGAGYGQKFGESLHDGKDDDLKNGHDFSLDRIRATGHVLDGG
jgi:hypothetical protein